MEVFSTENEDWDRLWQNLSDGMSKNPGRDYRYKQILNLLKQHLLILLIPNRNFF